MKPPHLPPRHFRRKLPVLVQADAGGGQVAGFLPPLVVKRVDGMVRGQLQQSFVLLRNGLGLRGALRDGLRGRLALRLLRLGLVFG